MTAVAVRGTPTQVSNTGLATMNLTVPSSTVEGDVMLALAIDAFTSGAAISGPAGWNLVGTVQTLTGGGLSAGVWWRAAHNETPGTTTYAWTLGGTHKALGTIIPLDGADLLQPFDGTVPTAIQTNTGATTFTHPTQVVTQPGDLVVSLVAGRDVTTSLTNNVWTQPTGHTKLVDAQTSSGSSINSWMGVGYRTSDAATYTSLTSSTVNSSTAVEWMLAFRPYYRDRQIERMGSRQAALLRASVW